jgi:hypothetical protein
VQHTWTTRVVAVDDNRAKRIESDLPNLIPNQKAAKMINH